MDEIYESINKSLIILKPYARVIKTGGKHLRTAFKELNFARHKSEKIENKKDAINVKNVLLLARKELWGYIAESKKQGTDVKLFIFKIEAAIEEINIAIAKCKALIKNS